MAGEKLLYKRGRPAWHSVLVECWVGFREGREAPERRDICILMVGSYYYMEETNTALQIIFPPIKK